MAQRLQRQIVVAVIRQNATVLLIEQQGPNDPIASWALPGGIVEEGELLTEALAREVREEAGLTIVNPGQLAYIVQLDNPADGYQSTTFVFEIREWDGVLQPADPNNLILSADFLPLSEAVSRLQSIPWRAMREPMISYLSDKVGLGSLWLYRAQLQGDDHLILIAHLPGISLPPPVNARHFSKQGGS